MSTKSLSQFLFELASPERLEILAAVAERPQKHAELARRLSMTGSETTRHLTRLARAQLVTKNPRGEHTLTGLARAMLAGLPFLEFLETNREYWLDHNVLVLEPAFIERLGELCRGSFTTGAYRVVAVQDEAVRKAERRIWVATEQRFEQAVPVFREKSRLGIDVRVLRPRRLVEEEGRSGPRVHRNFPLHLLPEVPLFLAVVDTQAGVCFPFPDGKIDLTTMILLEDPRGCGWAQDLFLSMWSRARDGPPAPSATRGGHATA